jgi:hypothetical protein
MQREAHPETFWSGARTVPVCSASPGQYHSTIQSIEARAPAVSAEGPRSGMTMPGLASGRLLVAGLLLGALANQFATGAPLVLNTQRLHLGSPDAPEWEWFAAWPPDARRLDLRFTAQPNVREATLFIRQDDVRQDWSVGLNGKRLGKLFLMEADLVHTIAIAPGTMRDGENVLSLLPPKENDDIVI